MKLILQKDQKRSMTGKNIFVTDATAELSPGEKENLTKYKMGKTLLYTNMENRGAGLTGMLSRAAIGVEITIDDLVNGKRVESKDIVEMLAIEEQIKQACQNFKIVLETMANFGGQEIVEF